MRNVIFGDSISQGGGAPPSPGLLGYGGVTWAYLASMVRGEPLDMRAVSGSNSADMMDITYGQSPAPGDRHLMLIGKNDIVHRGTSAAHIALFKSCVAAQVRWLAGSCKLARSSPSWSYSGTWAPTPVNGLGNYCTASGASASVQFSGDTFALAWIGGDVNFGSFSLSIDGVSYPPVSCTPPVTVSCAPFNRNYLPQLTRITGLGAGPHTAVMVVTSATGKAVFFDFVCDGSNGLPLHLLSIPASSIAAFAGASPSPSVAMAAGNAAIAAANSALLAAASEATTDGLGVHFIDACATLDYASADLIADGFHPSNQGYARMASAVLAAL